jgi:hypothetical protein
VCWSRYELAAAKCALVKLCVKIDERSIQELEQVRTDPDFARWVEPPAGGPDYMYDRRYQYYNAYVRGKLMSAANMIDFYRSINTVLRAEPDMVQGYQYKRVVDRRLMVADKYCTICESAGPGWPKHRHRRGLMCDGSCLDACLSHNFPGILHECIVLSQPRCEKCVNAALGGRWPEDRCDGTKCVDAYLMRNHPGIPRNRLVFACDYHPLSEECVEGTPAVKRRIMRRLHVVDRNAIAARISCRGVREYITS